MSAFNDSIEQHRGNINNEKTIIATIGRMNPPTSGHAGLIEYMFKEAMTQKLSQINIIISDTQDNKKNPLGCEDKRMILYNAIIGYVRKKLINEITNQGDDTVIPTKIDQINNMKVEIVCMDDPIECSEITNKILQCVEYLLTLYGYTNTNPATKLKFTLVIGEDRQIGQDNAGGFSFINTFLQNLNPKVVFGQLVLQRPDGAISATQIRGWALSDEEDQIKNFNNHYNALGFNEELINYIRDQIKIQINPKRCREPQDQTQSKIRKPNLGGKKRKTKKYKRKRNKKGTRKTRRYSLVAFSRR